MNIETARFGVLEIDEGKIINFVKGILGFPEDRQYILLPHSKDSPFLWLQSLNTPELAFVVINPALIVTDYFFEIPDGMERVLELERPSQAEILVLVTFRRREGERSVKMSANLLGPLVINAEKRLACQIVLDPKCYPVRYEFN